MSCIIKESNLIITSLLRHISYSAVYWKASKLIVKHNGRKRNENFDNFRSGVISSHTSW